MRERHSFIEEKDRMTAKILELEAMNDELLAKDLEVAQLEAEVQELSQSLEATLKREDDIQSQLVAYRESKSCSHIENYENVLSTFCHKNFVRTTFLSPVDKLLRTS